jgi:hypothetical protein
VTIEDKPAKRRSGKLWLIAALVLGLAAVWFFTPLNRFIAWLTLDVAALERQVDGHMRDVHRDAEYACLYAVDCSSGEARLQLQTQLTPGKLQRIRNEIWRRRFENYCTGKVANFGLAHGQLAGSEAKDVPQDCYAFGGGFGGAAGILSGCVFAPPGTWTPCTRDQAYWTREQGIVRQTPP